MNDDTNQNTNTPQTPPSPVEPIATENVDFAPPPQVTPYGEKPDDVAPEVKVPETPLVTHSQDDMVKDVASSPEGNATDPIGTTFSVDPIAPPTPQEMGDLPKEDKNKKGGLPPSGRSKKMKIVIPTILGIFLLVGGLAAGVLLIGQNQNIREKADEGDNQDPSGLGEICGGIGGILCDTGLECRYANGLTVPTNPDESGTCATIQRFTSSEEPDIQCLEVEAYEVDGNDTGVSNASNWTKLTQNALANLEAGDVVYFTITGQSSTPEDFTKARFKVNNANFVEVLATTNTKPKGVAESSNVIKLYYKYTIPQNVTQFTVKASIYHVDQGWIDPIE